MRSPTDWWMAYLEAAAGQNKVYQEKIIYGHVERVLLPQLHKEGFAVPPRRTLERALTTGLEPLQQQLVGQRQCKMCSFEHFLNLLWLPIIEYIEDLAKDKAPDWTESLALNQAAIMLEMQGLVPGAEVYIYI